VRLSSLVGLEGLTIGRLAQELRLSKSGLYAHFRSKEGLQLEVLRAAAAEFIAEVVRPALARPRGEPRVLGLFEGWLRWSTSGPLPGGCLFVAAAAELDDQEGPVRDELVALQKAWLATLARAIAQAQSEGHFRRELDPEQLTFELHGILLSLHHQARLLREPDAPARAREAYAALCARARGELVPSRYEQLLRRAGLDGPLN
jgi:AcrR family transcriptional regulator